MSERFVKGGGKVTLDGKTVNLSQGGGFFFQEAGTGTIEAAGLQTIDGKLLTFCIELTQFFNPNSSSMTYEVIDLEDAPKPDSASLIEGMGDIKADQLRLLWAIGMDDGAIADQNSSAAFQPAIWKILYGESLTLTNFSSSVAEQVLAKAEGWVSAAKHLYTDPGASAFMADLVALSSDDYQDFLALKIPGPEPQLAPVPEPSSLMAWLLLGSAVGYGMRRRTTKAA